MNILHYALGLAPARSGGLTRYATDLIRAQLRDGECVSLLYPGRRTWLGNRCWIGYPKEENGLKTYELVNSAPIPLLYGVRSPQDILKVEGNVDLDSVERFLNEVNPDVFHIHTMMGLPLAVLSAMKARGVKIVFSTHDYFGLCPRVNFVKGNGQLCPFDGDHDCASCNQSAPSSLFLNVRNSQMLLHLKNNKWVRRVFGR